MKKIVILLIFIAVLFSAVSISYAYPKWDQYETYLGYEEGNVYISGEEYEKVREYWEEKIDEMAVPEDMYVFKYEVRGYGGIEKLGEIYFETGSLFSTAIKYRERNPGLVIAEEFLPNLKEKLKSNLEDIIKHNQILKGFDYLSEDLKFHIVSVEYYGTFVVITDGEKEVYYLYSNNRADLKYENQLYSPRQVLSILMYYSETIEYPDYADYTKEAPSNGGSEVVGVAVLAAGASLLGAVADAVLGKKRSTRK